MTRFIESISRGFVPVGYFYIAHLCAIFFSIFLLFGILQKCKAKSELIVVASLVRKIPNLGGMSRTCEVFCVDGYAISNLTDIERSEFQALR
jgi:hypothetical protein